MFIWYWIAIGCAVAAVGFAIWGICWEHSMKHWDGFWQAVASGCLGGIAVVLAIASLCARISAKITFNELKANYEHITQAIENADDREYANAGVIGTIVEYNNILDHINTKKATMGIWSVYYDLPVEELHYIGIEDTEK